MTRHTQALSFEGEHARFARGGKVSGMQADLQLFLVVLNTEPGSDKLFEAKGTGLRRSTLGGRIQDAVSAGHVVNFAVASGINFLRSLRTPGELEEPDRLARIVAAPTDFQNRRMRVDIRAYNGRGEQSTITHTSPLT